jgi:AcrR family transcriptional regulator
LHGKSSPPPEPHPPSTEQRILQAARTVFLRRGTAGARMQEIAEEAGVNPALLHYYFRSKDRLASAIFREAAGRLLPSLMLLMGSERTIEEKVEQFIHLYIDTVRSHPFLPGYVVAELHQHPERVTALMAEAAGVDASRVVQEFGRLDAQLRERAAAGALRPIAPEQFLVSMIGLAAAPFLAWPALHLALGMDDEAFARFLDQRRAELPAFILRALRP